VDEDERDYDYYRRRAAEELAKAREAPDPDLAAKHRQLATIYTSRALQAERHSEVGKRADGSGNDAEIRD